MFNVCNAVLKYKKKKTDDLNRTWNLDGIECMYIRQMLRFSFNHFTFLVYVNIVSRRNKTCSHFFLPLGGDSLRRRLDRHFDDSDIRLLHDNHTRTPFVYNSLQYLTPNDLYEKRSSYRTNPFNVHGSFSTNNLLKTMSRVSSSRRERVFIHRVGAKHTARCTDTRTRT